jgi:hypothetical protein
VHAARSPAVTLAVAYIKDPKTSRRGGRPASGGADGEARPAADLASPSRCHKPPEESAASHRLWRHDARKLIADVHTYAPPTRGLQTCCCAEGHGEDHPLHHQEETDATCNLSSASRQVSKPPPSGRVLAIYVGKEVRLITGRSDAQGKFITCAARAGVHLLCAKQRTRQPHPRRRSIDGRPAKREDTTRRSTHDDSAGGLGSHLLGSSSSRLH